MQPGKSLVTSFRWCLSEWKLKSAPWAVIKKWFALGPYCGHKAKFWVPRPGNFQVQAELGDVFALRTASSLRGVKQWVLILWVRCVLAHWIRELDAEVVEHLYLCRDLLCSQDSTALSCSINNGTWIFLSFGSFAALSRLHSENLTFWRSINKLNQCDEIFSCVAWLVQMMSKRNTW